MLTISHFSEVTTLFLLFHYFPKILNKLHGLDFLSLEKKNAVVIFSQFNLCSYVLAQPILTLDNLVPQDIVQYLCHPQ